MVSALVLGILIGAPQLKVRVDGDGYLRFARDGRAVYAASATLTVSDGALVGPGGASLLPPMAISSTATALSVDLEGNVSYRSGGKTIPAGRLVLALFPKQAALRADGAFMVSSDRPQLGNPGDGANGVIRMIAPPAEWVQSMPQPGPNKTLEPKKEPNPTFAGKPQISVSASSEVSGDQILLGEIADIKADPDLKEKLASISVGETPAIGVPRTIYAGHIEIRLRMAGLKPEQYQISVPAQASVTRKCQRVTPDRFLDVAKAAAKEKLGIDVPLVCKDRTNEFCAPVGELELTVESCTKTTSGVSVLIAVRVDGRRINSRVVNLAVDNNAEGVKSGDTVKILLRSGGATFEIKGKARTAGWVGQTVTVVTDTGSTHTGTVLSSSVVEVKL